MAGKIGPEDCMLNDEDNSDKKFKRRTYLQGIATTGAASAVGLGGLSTSSATAQQEEQTRTDFDGGPNDNPDNDEFAREIQWGNLGSENATQECPGEFGYWKWVLTPGGPQPLELPAELTVQFADGTEQTVEGFFPGGGRGALQFEVFKEGGGTVESAVVRFNGGGANPRLTISEGGCVEDPDDIPDVTVTTEPATEINDSTATLNGFLEDLGGFESVDVFFEYRVQGAIDWETTAPQTLTEPGPFDTEIDVEPGTDYDFRAVVVAPDNTTVRGAILTFTKEDVPDITKPTVVTGPATDINESTATLNGDLEELGDFDEVDVFFEYRPVSTDEWFATEPETLAEPGPFSAEIDVEQGVEYEYRAVAVANDTRATGETLTFRKEKLDPDKDLPEVATKPATDVNKKTATLNGHLITLGDFDEVDVFFEYRIVGADEWLVTDTQTLTEPGPFSDEISGLLTGVEYEFRAIAAANGVIVAGPIQRFTKKRDKKERRKKKKLEKKKRAYECKKREYKKYKKKYEKCQIDKNTLEKKKADHEDAKRKYERYRKKYRSYKRKKLAYKRKKDEYENCENGRVNKKTYKKKQRAYKKSKQDFGPKR